MSPIITILVTESSKETSRPGIVRFTVSLPVAMNTELERIGRRDSRSRAWLIRKAVEALLKQENPLFHMEVMADEMP